MAADSGRPKPSLIDRMLDQPYRFSFFQAVRLLEKQCADKVAVGHQGPPGREAVAMGVDPQLGFPASDVSSVEALGDGQAPAYRLTANFLGLHGSASPLPTFYAVDVLHDVPSGGTLRSFLDVFHHRLLSLFYRCWIRFRYHFLFRPGGTDEFSRYMFCLTGLGGRDLCASTGFDAVRFLRFAGFATQKPHSAAALRGLIADFFAGVPVRIRQALGRWLPLGHAQRSTLALNNCRLGDNLCLGDRVYDRMSKFRVVIGPLDYDAYEKLLPGGEWNQTLKKIVQLFSVDRLDFDFELILRADQTPRLCLDLTGESRLGWTTGFYTKERAREDVAVVFA